MNEENKIPERVAEINRQIAASPLASQGISQAPSAITSESLQTESPFNLIQSQPVTEVDGLLGYFESEATSFQKDQQKKQEQELTQLKTQTETAKKSFLQRLGLSSGEQEKTAIEYQKEVDPLEQELNAINQEIFAEQNALRKRIESIQAQSGGLTSGVQPAIEAEKRKSASYQADLYIKQMGIQGRYDSAKRIADRKIAVELEREKRDLEMLKFDYTENKELFTTAEQRQFEQAQSDRERELNRKESEMQLFETTRIDLLRLANEQGAPLSVKTAIANAKTTEEAIQAAGQYGGDILERQIKQAQLQKYQLDAAKALEELNKVPSGTNIQAQAQAKGNIDLIGELVSDSNLKGAVGPTFLTRLAPIGRFTGGKSNFIAGIEQLRSNLNLEALITAKSRGATFGALSDQELRVLANAASKIGSWAIKDEDGNVIGYKASESDFRKELDKINNFAKLDYLIKGGSPEDIGAQVMDDGSIWVINSDGSYTQLN